MNNNKMAQYSSAWWTLPRWTVELGQALYYIQALELLTPPLPFKCFFWGQIRRMKISKVEAKGFESLSRFQMMDFKIRLK